MISERLMKEETLEGPLFESLFNQQIGDDQYDSPSSFAGMPSVEVPGEQKSLPFPGAAASYPLPSQLQPPSP